MSSLLYNSPASFDQSRGENKSEFQFDRNITRAPESVITIFTTNTRDLYSSTANVKYPGRAKDERYRKVATLNDPYYEFDTLSLEAGGFKKDITADNGQWVAMDRLNPDNIYKLDQDFIVPNGVENGTNLLNRGMFFIVRPYDPVNGNQHDVPTDGEIAAPEVRLRERYTALVRLYNQTSAATPAKLPTIMSEEMVDALNFAGMRTPYNTTLDQKVSCPVCGDQKLAVAKFHRSDSLGVICIEPSETGWRAAVAAGIKTKDDVPEEYRWANPVGRPKQS